MNITEEQFNLSLKVIEKACELALGRAEFEGANSSETMINSIQVHQLFVFQFAV